MLGFLKELKSCVRVNPRSWDHVSVDTVVSALHHRITSAILLICCALVSCRQYFGEPILCIQDGPDDDTAIPSNVLNTYCFITSTYTVVGPEGETWRGQGTAEHRHAYYQWVPFILFLQSLLFASPHAFWCNWEGGLVRGSLTGIRDEVRGPDRDKLRTLARYFTARLHTLRIWAAGFYVCELLNLLNVVANMFLTSLLLGRNFYQYGLQMIQYGLVTVPLSIIRSFSLYTQHWYMSYRFADSLQAGSGWNSILILLAGCMTYTIATLEISPADVMFPKLTKCMFRKYGPSGTIQIHDALCVMALNVVNEKIFVALWFWFVLLALVSGLALLWRLLLLGLLSCASVYSRSFVSVWAQRAVGAPVTLDPAYLSPVIRRLDCGDWLFLQLLGANMGSKVYREFIEQLVQSMEQAKQSDVWPIWNR